MLPSWLERVRIAIHPGGFDGAVTRCGDGKLLRHESIPVSGGDDGDWHKTLAMMPELLSALNAKNRETRVVLSNAMTRFLVLPWQEALENDEDWQSFARHGYVGVYGATAETWRIRLAIQGYGQPVVACAMDNELAEGIIATLSDSGVRLAGVIPFFNAGIERFRKRLKDKESWFVQSEPGQLTLSRISNGSIIHIATRRIDHVSPEAVSQVVARELDRCAFDPHDAPLYYHATGNVPAPRILTGNIPVTSLAHMTDSPAGLTMALC